MEYKNALSYLYNLRTHGIKLGLDNMIRAGEILGRPQSSFNTIHIAGTNGKGTIAKTFQTLLSAKGYKTGLFTSPHLTRFTERIVINKTEITEEDVIDLTIQIQDKISSMPSISPTFFEIVTLMAFLYFKKMAAEWAVFETGLGGRFDSTNIISPKLCIITNINEDHKEFLGETIKEIAFEKAGIIKPNCPIISMLQSDEAMDVIKERAQYNSSPLYIYGRDFSAEDIVTDISGTTFLYRGKQNVLISTPIYGVHQVQNISCAIKGFELLFGGDGGFAPIVQTALKDLRWQARYELVDYHGKTILIDGAHNPAAIKALAQTVRELYYRHYREIILIIGIMSDKDIPKMLKHILPISRHVIFTAPAYGRAESPQVLKDIAKKIILDNQTDFHISSDTLDALKKAIKLSSDKSLILVTGSFYVIGEIKELMGEKTILKDLAEVFKQTKQNL